MLFKVKNWWIKLEIKSKPDSCFNPMYKEAHGEEIPMSIEIQSSGIFLSTIQHEIINRFSSRN